MSVIIKSVHLTGMSLVAFNLQTSIPMQAIIENLSIVLLYLPILTHSLTHSLLYRLIKTPHAGCAPRMPFLLQLPISCSCHCRAQRLTHSPTHTHSPIYIPTQNSFSSSPSSPSSPSSSLTPTTHSKAAFHAFPSPSSHPPSPPPLPPSSSSPPPQTTEPSMTAGTPSNPPYYAYLTTPNSPSN